jgi:hypothetical protein
MLDFARLYSYADMSTFFIAPYEPTDDPSRWEALKTTSDLRIDPTWYREQLVRRWADIEFFEIPSPRPLHWSLYTKAEGGELIPQGSGSLQANLQVISMGTPVEEFFLWHRSIIPRNYRLFLFNDSSWDSLELTPGTTIEEISRFIADRS